MEKTVRRIEGFIFWSRWLQLPMYLGLIVALGVYAWKFVKSLAAMVMNLPNLTENDILLQVLGLIDVVMIANLLVMVIIGGYETFVSRLHLDNHPDQPDWLDHIDAGVLKVKLGVALISISSIHLLRSFINTANLSEHTLLWEIRIHMVLVISALVLMVTDWMLSKKMAQAHPPSQITTDSE
jgi:uncharacterized protein (TIGR00645 family)